MPQSLRSLVPRPVKRFVRRIRDRRETARLFGPLAPMVPDVELMFDGSPSVAEFKANGEEFLRIYREVCGLRPDERMLDVGCGIGRKTLPLTQYLDGRARYEGIDITRAGIDWCQERITPRYPGFRFQHIDVYNLHYNPGGTQSSAEYRFPFADGSFSFAMLGSVFTHMLPADLENYLSETARVLAPGGRCLITYFLLNEESRRLMAAGLSALDFKHVLGNGPGDTTPGRTVSREVPEQAIAFDEAWIRDLYRDRGLRVARIDYGSWCGRTQHLSYQDLLLAVKD